MKPFQFLTLRYLHDAITGEFVNLGVVVFVPGEFLGARFNLRTSRLRAVFGQVEKPHLKSLLGYLDRRIQSLASELSGSLIQRTKKLEELLHTILPPDDSAVQWSSSLGGLTSNPEEELGRLFSRLVTHYEDADSILDKGSRWLGRGIALHDAPEPHKFWFLVGEPETEKHKRATGKALNLIHKIGTGKVEFVRESERESFAESLAREILNHS